MTPILLGLVLGLSPNDYARPDLLAEPADLRKPTTNRMVRVLDARGKGKYLDGHYPGAVWINAPAWAHAFAKGQNAADWEKRIAPLGVAPADTVVIYDDSQSKVSARIWYILRYWGFDDMHILNGGWKALQAAGGSMQKEPPAVQPVKDLKFKAQPGRLATKTELLDLLKGKAPQIVDARSEGEYRGTEETAKRTAPFPARPTWNGATHSTRRPDVSRARRS